MKSPVLLPRNRNRTLLALTRAKAKMFEFQVPSEDHINLEGIQLEEMLDLAIGILAEAVSESRPLINEERKPQLIFTSSYLYSLLESGVVSEYREIIALLTAAAYYLSGFPGSSQVVLHEYGSREGSQLEDVGKLLFAVLSFDTTQALNLTFNNEPINQLASEWNYFLQNPQLEHDFSEALTSYHTQIYSEGSDQELVFYEILRVCLNQRLELSLRMVLSRYSNSAIEMWEDYLTRGTSIREFWPAQMKLAEKGVFRGASAVIQMPTSAGKTKACDIIIRSSFLSGRSSLALIVAPFRALCQEIYLNLDASFALDDNIEVSLVSDVLQNENLSYINPDNNVILILTPEKLDLLLKFNPTFAARIGLIFYDEGHLFDSKKRGAKYELLLSRLKMELRSETQVVLMSAVISNPTDIKDWLIGQSGVLVDGEGMTPTGRSVAFVEWEGVRRNLRFVDEKDSRRELFFVPTVLKSEELRLVGRERKAKRYPSVDSEGVSISSEVAGFLACRLSKSGLVSVFAGQKRSVDKIVRELREAYDRGLTVQKPIEFTDNSEECMKMIKFIRRILGSESIYAKGAEIGILVHHGNIPQGLRVVSEVALSRGYFKVVVCTSTLTQGLNLPVRYLVVSSLYQDRNAISVRDFHNLMGRAGRSGKYAEGTIIFSDPEIFQSSGTLRGKRSLADRILDGRNAESTLSLLTDLLNLAPVSDSEGLQSDSTFQLILQEVKSFLLDQITDIDTVQEAQSVAEKVATNTLAYSQLKDSVQRNLFVDIFKRLSIELYDRFPVSTTRSAFAKSCLSLDESQKFIQDFVREGGELVWESINSEPTEHEDDLIEILWSYLYKYAMQRSPKAISQSQLWATCQLWISGASFIAIQEGLQSNVENLREDVSVGNIVNICENLFGYQISMIMGSLVELIKTELSPLDSILENRLKLVQKKLKYGLPDKGSIALYELGFIDRELTSNLWSLLSPVMEAVTTDNIIASLRSNSVQIAEILEGYPAFFKERLIELSVKTGSI